MIFTKSTSRKGSPRRGPKMTKNEPKTTPKWTPNRPSGRPGRRPGTTPKSRPIFGRFWTVLGPIWGPIWGPDGSPGATKNDQKSDQKNDTEKEAKRIRSSRSRGPGRRHGRGSLVVDIRLKIRRQADRHVNYPKRTSGDGRIDDASGVVTGRPRLFVPLPPPRCRHLTPAGGSPDRDRD